MNSKAVHAGHTPTDEHRDDHTIGICMLLAFMYLILFATLYLIWLKANPVG